MSAAQSDPSSGTNLSLLYLDDRSALPVSSTIRSLAMNSSRLGRPFHPNDKAFDDPMDAFFDFDGAADGAPKSFDECTAGLFEEFHNRVEGPWNKQLVKVGRIYVYVAEIKRPGEFPLLQRWTYEAAPPLFKPKTTSRRTANQVEGQEKAKDKMRIDGLLDKSGTHNYFGQIDSSNDTTALIERAANHDVDEEPTEPTDMDLAVMPVPATAMLTYDRNVFETDLAPLLTHNELGTEAIEHVIHTEFRDRFYELLQDDWGTREYHFRAKQANELARELLLFDAISQGPERS